MILIAKKGDHHYGKYIRVLKKLANCNFECQITNIFPYLFGFPPLIFWHYLWAKGFMRN